MYFLALSISAALYSFGYFLNDGGVDYLKHLTFVYAPFLLFLGNFSLILNKCQICDFTDPLGRMCTALILPLWSLCVEEQFYLIWPLVVKWTTPKTLIRTALSLVMAALVLRIVLWSFSMKDHNYLAYYYNSACNVDALMLGGTLAIMRVHFEDVLKLFNRFLIPAALLSASLVVGMFCTLAGSDIDSLPIVFAMTFLPLLMTVFLHCIMELAWLQRFFAASPLANFGKYTYSAYLFHYVVICALNQIFLRQFLHIGKLSRYIYIFSIALFITFILARCAWQFIELPFLKLRLKL
jgi:peptidoglycan/LPS O-acetylase OafA/YrhL